PGFGASGVVDLKLDDDQDMDLVTGEVGLHAAPTVAKDMIIVGAAHLPGGVPKSRRNEKGYVRAFDVRTGKRLWIFHTIPRPGEFGTESWLKGSAEYTGNTGVWAQISVDEDLETVYLPVEEATGDYFGANRPGDDLFAESVDGASWHQLGPLYPPPRLSKIDGPLGTLMAPSQDGGTNWPGGSFDPETGVLYVASSGTVVSKGLVAPYPEPSDMAYVEGNAVTGPRTSGGSGSAAGGGRSEFNGAQSKAAPAVDPKRGEPKVALSV